MIRDEWSTMDHEERIELLEWILAPREGTLRLHSGDRLTWQSPNGDCHLWSLSMVFEIIDWIAEGEASKDASGWVRSP